MSVVHVYPDAGEHVVDVHSACDLPTPVEEVIELEEGLVYQLHDIIDIGENSIMCPDHVKIVGTTSTSTGFSSSTSVPMFSTPVGGQHLVMYGTSLRQTGPGMVMNLAHTGADTVTEITHCLVQAGGGVLAHSYCDFTTVRYCVMRGFTDGWHVKANASAVTCRSCLGINGGSLPMWDLESSVVSAGRWADSTYVGSGLLFSGPAASANVAPGGQCRVTNVAWIGPPPLDFISPQDIRWQFTGCSGVVNSYDLHHTRMSANTVLTTFGAPDVYVLAGGVSTSGSSPRFDDNGGVSHTIRCQGEIVSPALLSVSFRMTKSGATRSYTVGFFKNDVLLTGGAEETFNVSGSPDVTYSFSVEDPLRNVDDVYDIRVRPNGHTNSCTLVSLRLSFQSN